MESFDWIRIFGRGVFAVAAAAVPDIALMCLCLGLWVAPRVFGVDLIPGIFLAVIAAARLSPKDGLWGAAPQRGLACGVLYFGLQAAFRRWNLGRAPGPVVELIGRRRRAPAGRGGASAANCSEKRGDCPAQSSRT